VRDLTGISDTSEPLTNSEMTARKDLYALQQSGNEMLCNYTIRTARNLRWSFSILTEFWSSPCFERYRTLVGMSLASSMLGFRSRNWGWKAIK
jgi:hypothetical protein